MVNNHYLYINTVSSSGRQAERILGAASGSLFTVVRTCGRAPNMCEDILVMGVQRHTIDDPYLDSYPDPGPDPHPDSYP